MSPAALAGGGGYSLSANDTLGFNSGDTSIKTGATFNFAKPASATGIDLSANVGWLLIAAGAGLVLLLVMKKKGGA